MSQYVYLVKKHTAETLEIVDKVLEPKAQAVIDFLDRLAEEIAVNADTRLLLSDNGRQRSTNGRVLPARKINEQALRNALHKSSNANDALKTCFQEVANQPEALFKLDPGGMKNWHIVRELLEFRTLLNQARAKPRFYVAICHD